MIGVVIAYLGGNFLYARIVTALQQFLRVFQTDIDQIMYWRVSSFALKDFGNIKGSDTCFLQSGPEKSFPHSDLKSS